MRTILRVPLTGFPSAPRIMVVDPGGIMSQATTTHRGPTIRATGRQKTGREESPISDGVRAGRHRSDGRAGTDGHTSGRPTRASASRLIVLGFAIALLLGWPSLIGNPVAQSLAWAGMALGGVFVGVGTVAAGVRLGLRWFDDRP
jgi:hypothetical protein